MAVNIRVKRGTEQKILESDLQLAEMAFATDTCTLWGFNGLYKCVVGRAIVDNAINRTTYSGSAGRLFYGSDNHHFYVHDGNSWEDITISGGGGGEVYLHGYTGINIIQDGPDYYIYGPSISGTDGVSVQMIGNTWEISASGVMQYVSQDLMGGVTISGSVPTASGSAGEVMFYQEGIGWVSVSRSDVSWGYPNNSVRDSWLLLWGSLNISSAQGGYYMFRDGMITRVAVTRENYDGAGDCTISICKNYNPSQVVASAVLPNGSYRVVNMSISEGHVEQGVTLHCLHSAAGTARSTDPHVQIEIAWIAETASGVS